MTETLSTANQVQPVELPEEIEALALAVLEKVAKDGKDLVKATIGGRYPDGRRETFRSPIDGKKLGLVYRTDPDPVWTVTDAAAFDEDLRQDPANVETVAEIVGSDEQVIAVLAEHAPELLAVVTRVRQDARDAAIRAAKAGAEIPGVSKVKPAGSLTVTPDRNQARDAISGLIQAGLLTWDGRRALPEGTGGAA